MKFEWLFEPRDLWIGVYWTVKPWGDVKGNVDRYVEIYVCFVPCLPIKISWELW